MPLTNVTPRTGCLLKRYLEDIDDASREVLQSWLDDDRWSTQAILTELREQAEQGNVSVPKLSSDVIRRHRKIPAECACRSAQ